MSSTKPVFLGATALLMFLSASAVAQPVAAPPGTAPAAVSTPAWPDVAVGSSLESCRKALGTWDAKATIQELPLTQPQAVAKGLIDSGLLKALNKAAFGHALLDRAHGKEVTFLLASGAAGSVALGFVGGKLEVWLWRAVVKVDPKVGEKENPFTAARLAPIHGFFNEVGRRCKVRPKGNAESGRLRVAGHCGSQRVYVEYIPQGDEVWLVFSK